MKNSSIISTLLILLIIGCNPEKTYFDQLIKDKTITERVVELNKTLTEIRKTENKSALVKEEEDYLEYEYKIGIDETFNVTYFFDVAGCYEVGLDTYFNNEVDAQLVMEKIKEEIENSDKFKLKTDTNQLIEWSSTDGLASIELDYENLNKGMVSFTVFANE
ncbi:hypothetical protein FRY74_11830 [Vicingus serpentipes]|uniref:Lipoprotein n=1 Tax=Vicingus serpentipes TaxID=1926625 RepID=A0A5C6RNX8_9FLAO|nr:hypothetical protein [Vicingus serpentipes]TXB63937.1 hypothetical protein FRY74_11830 [Vicingus serpentipes]